MTDLENPALFAMNSPAYLVYGVNGYTDGVELLEYEREVAWQVIFMILYLLGYLVVCMGDRRGISYRQRFVLHVV